MKITFNEKIYELNEGADAFALLKLLEDENKKDYILYKLNEQNYDLSEPFKGDSTISFVKTTDEESFKVINHDAAHLLAQAIKELYPDAKFGIGPAIDEGFYYDIDFNGVSLNDGDLVKIEQKMKQLAKKDFRITHKEVSKKQALEIFKDNEYKVELIKELEGKITIYSQGDFTDLCVGPHMPSTKYVKNFKLLSLAGAYWRGNSQNKQLTRIYGIAFFTKEELDAHLSRLEEAKKRDHRKLGKELGLFHISEYGPGFPFWLPNGTILYNELENYWLKLHQKNGYVFVKTPTILSKELWEVSGHWKNYRENMYTTKIDENDFAIKPMNCPGSILIYKNGLHSYKDLPIRMAELGNVHRHEASGALAGLFRVRNFTQDDAHVYCTRDQLKDEITRALKLFDEIYSTFGLSYHIELSTRPEDKYIGEIAVWDESEKVLAEVLSATGKAYKLNPGDGAFYGPKLDFKLRDSIGRIWQCGTIQLDMNLPERFDITYIDANNTKQRPIMLHRAIFGSMERFIGILTEHFAGAFPVWLAPLQVSILPVNNQFHTEYAQKVFDDLFALDLRVKLDDSNEKLGYRIRNSQMQKIPFTIVIGDNERDNNLVTYRRHGQESQTTVTLDEFKALINQEISFKTFQVA